MYLKMDKVPKVGTFPLQMRFKVNLTKREHDHLQVT